MHPDAQWRPSTASERYRTIDIIRGLALFGVLIINILSGFRVSLLEHVFHRYADPAFANRFVEILAASVLEFKSLTTFSFLFGVGLSIQAERAAARDVAVVPFLTRRMGWLFVIGIVHMFLIWNGDILALYSICGLLLIPFLRLRWPALLLIGAALIALPEIAWFGIDFPTGPAAQAAIARAREVYAHGSFVTILRFRWQEAWSLIIPVLIAVLPRTAGLMFLGSAAWRSGILRLPERHRGKLLVAFLLGVAIGGAITINEVRAAATGGHPWPPLHFRHLDPSILLAMGYVAGLLLWLNTSRAGRLPGVAALGQMALTNYLLQSVVMGFVFYGYGFGFFGRMGSAAAASIGVALYILQVQMSRRWLRRFRFGPVEWLWRSLTYGRRQPMRRSTLAAGMSG